MKCLYCGKKIKDTASDHEKINGWHLRCIKAFFGTAEMPKLDISEEKLEELANETINKGLTVPGVQKKLSLHLSSDIDSRLTIVDYPTGYILKPQTEEYESLPEFENLAMNMAEIAGIKTVPNALIKNNGQYAYITKRIDRNIIDDNQVQMYAMEDFCQLALTLNGKKSRLKKKDFIAFAASCDISEKAAEKMISKVCSLKDKFFSACDESYLSSECIKQMKQLISDRIDILK